MVNFKLVGTDNIQLSVNKYLVDNMKGIVLCVHGMCEHSKRYDDFALFLNNNGYSVYTYDQRGHGNSLLSGETHGFIGKDGFNKLVYDLDVVVSYIKEKHPERKLFILGHSMGSFVTQRYFQLYDKVDGVILSGSNYGTKALGFGRLVSKLACIFKGEKNTGKLLDKLSFGSFNKSFYPNRTEFDWLSRDEKEVDKYIKDDYCGFICSNRFYYDFFGGLLDVNKYTSNVNKEVPLLIISGDKDPVGNNGIGVRNLYNEYSNYLNNVELKLYKEARHEILNETNKNEVYQDILKWLHTNEE